MIDFDHVLDAINDVTQKSEKYVIGNHFTEQSSLSLADWATFLSFKEDKTLQSDIENYISNYKPELDIPSKQFISSQRTYIRPVMFQDISKRYLELIDYKNDNQTLRLLKDLDYVQVMDQTLKFQIFPKHEQNSILTTP